MAANIHDMFSEVFLHVTVAMVSLYRCQQTSPENQTDIMVGLRYPPILAYYIYLYWSVLPDLARETSEGAYENKPKTSKITTLCTHT